MAQFGIPVRLPSIPLSKRQKAYLQTVYQTNHHPSKTECTEIAEALDLALKKIEKWFWDQRTKDKSKP